MTSIKQPAPTRQLKLQGTQAAKPRSSKLELGPDVRLQPVVMVDEGQNRNQLEAKAQIYAALEHGEVRERSKQPLIDFDRKWAEKQHIDLMDQGKNDYIEFEDEFGRTRRGTKVDKEMFDNQQHRRMPDRDGPPLLSSRPAPPDQLIFGDAIQTLAFHAKDPDEMNELAHKRDRSLTPPPFTFYDASRENRVRGVGFYSFSLDIERRIEEASTLGTYRTETNIYRKQKYTRSSLRHKRLNHRRRNLDFRRATKLTDDFLKTQPQTVVGHV
jgi:hypothetical protein